MHFSTSLKLWPGLAVLAALASPLFTSCTDDPEKDSRLRKGIEGISKTDAAREQLVSQMLPDAIEIKEDEGIQVPIKGVANSGTEQFYCNKNYLSVTTDNPSILNSETGVSLSGSWPKCLAAIKPIANANGKVVLTIALRSEELPLSKNMEITIIAINDAPSSSGGDKELEKEANSEAEFELAKGSDVDSASEEQKLSYSVVTSATHGSLSNFPADGSGGGRIKYTPSANYFGTDTFTYRICDNDISPLCTAEIKVKVAIRVQDPPAPTGSETAQVVQEKSKVSLTLGGSSDPQGMELHYVVTESPKFGNLGDLPKVESSGQTTHVNFTAGNFAKDQKDTLSYKVCQAGDTICSEPHNLEITITATDDAPVAAGSTEALTEDTAKSLTLAYTDGEGHLAETCTLSGLSHISAGPCTCTAGVCTVEISPDLNFNGPTNFDFMVTANGKTSNISAVSIVVNPEKICPPHPTSQHPPLMKIQQGPSNSAITTSMVTRRRLALSPTYPMLWLRRHAPVTVQGYALWV